MSGFLIGFTRSRERLKTQKVEKDAGRSREESLETGREEMGALEEAKGNMSGGLLTGEEEIVTPRKREKGGENSTKDAGKSQM